QSVSQHGDDFPPLSHRVMFDFFALRMLCTPPFRGTLLCDAIKISTQTPTFGLKPVWLPPYLGECFLHHVLGRLRVANGMLQKRPQPGRIFPIERLKCVRISAVNLPPELGVIGQSLAPSSYSGLWDKKFALESKIYRAPEGFMPK